jgi:hypothetical protein
MTTSRCEGPILVAPREGNIRAERRPKGRSRVRLDHHGDTNVRNSFLFLAIPAALVSASLLVASAARAGGEGVVANPTPVISEEPPKEVPKTVSKPAKPLCTWYAVNVTVTEYGQATTDAEKKTWWKKFEEKALKEAKAFVKKNASAMGKTIMTAIIENTSILKAKDVIITYACVDSAGNVVSTKNVVLTDEYALAWWSAGAVVTGHEHEKASAIAKNKPTAMPTPAK